MEKIIVWFRCMGKMRFFLILGLLLAVFGIVILVTSPKEYAETTATVTRSEEYFDTEEGSSWDVYFEYTVDGKRYESSFGSMGSAKREGETMKIYYDPSNPQNTSNTKAGGIIGIAAIVAGIVCTGFCCRQGFKAYRELQGN